MLATAWPEPFDDPEWVWELKWDGVRTILTWDGDKVSLRSRRGNDATDRYPELQGSVEGPAVVVDGEIVALEDGRRPSFQLLQQRMNLHSAHLVREAMQSVPVSFVAFDLLYAERPLVDRPIEERLARLAELRHTEIVVAADRYEGDPSSLWEVVEATGLEGIVGKRRNSVYRPGVRSPDWRKIAVRKRLRAVVGGFTAGTGGRSGSFGGLQVGLWRGDRLRWIGSVGTGFDDATLRAIRAALDEMVLDASPFEPDHEIPRGVTWVEPTLVAVVEFKEWTAGPRLRAPVFVGFSDEPAATVTWDSEGPEG